MPLMMVPCEQCGEENRGISIQYPNPDVRWCDKCKQQIGSSSLEHHFCSWDCLMKWVENHRVRVRHDQLYRDSKARREAEGLNQTNQKVNRT